MKSMLESILGAGKCFTVVTAGSRHLVAPAWNN